MSNIKMFKNKYFQFAACILISLIIACGIYIVTPRILRGMPLFYNAVEKNPTSEPVSISLYDDNGEGLVIEQQFVPAFEYFTGIGIAYELTEGQIVRPLCIKVLDVTDNSEVGYYENISPVSREGDVYKGYYFDKALKLDVNHVYSFRIISNVKDNPSLRTNVESQSEAEALYVDGTIAEGGLCYTQYGYSEGCTARIYYLMVLILFAILLGLALFVCIRKPYFNGDYSLCDIIPLIIAVISFAVFFHQGWDMALSVKHAKDLFERIIHGQLGGFYTFALEKALSGGYGGLGIRDAAFYNIFIYIAMVIMMLPVWGIEKIIGTEIPQNASLAYFALVIAVFLLLSANLIYRITFSITANKTISKRTAFIYCSSYLLLYTTVGFCQIDILYILLIEWAINCYINNKNYKFAVIMSAAIMLKSFPVIFFVPLVLLVEKRIIHIIKYMLIGISFPLLGILVTRGDEGYAITSGRLKEVYGFTNRLFANGLNVGVGFAALLIIVIIILCVWSFDKNIIDKDRWKYAIIIPLISMSAFFIFVLWHPQWFIMLVPFICLACGIDTERRSLLYCEWGIGICVSVMSCIYLPANVDNYMVNYGIFPLLTGHCYGGISLASVFQRLNQNFYTFISSVMVALILYSCYYVMRDIGGISDPSKYETKPVDRGLIMVRIVSAYIFAIMLVCTYFYIG